MLSCINIESMQATKKSQFVKVTQKPFAIQRPK